MALEKLVVGMPREDVEAKWGTPHSRSVKTERDGIIIETWRWSWPTAMASVTFGAESTVAAFTINERLRVKEKKA